jgi:hypothetical protein
MSSFIILEGAFIVMRSFGHDSRLMVSYDYKIYSYTVVAKVIFFVITAIYKASEP